MLNRSRLQSSAYYACLGIAMETLYVILLMGILYLITAVGFYYYHLR